MVLAITSVVVITFPVRPLAVLPVAVKVSVTLVGLVATTPSEVMVKVATPFVTVTALTVMPSVVRLLAAVYVTAEAELVRVMPDMVTVRVAAVLAKLPVALGVATKGPAMALPAQVFVTGIVNVETVPYTTLAEGAVKA